MDIFFAALVGAFAGFLGAIIFFASPEFFSDGQKFYVICEYRGGEVGDLDNGDDVCIKNGSVITIDIPGDN